MYAKGLKTGCFKKEVVIFVYVEIMKMPVKSGHVNISVWIVE